jgi:hypothetical protein
MDEPLEREMPRVIYFADINLGEEECHGLVRVRWPTRDGDDHAAFMLAKAERWSPGRGWFDSPHFQLDFVRSGGDVTRDYQQRSADRVEAAQQSLREWMAL